MVNVALSAPDSEIDTLRTRFVSAQTGERRHLPTGLSEACNYTSLSTTARAGDTEYVRAYLVAELQR